MKIALFYRVWFDTGEKFLAAAKKKGVDLVPIQYNDLVLRQKGANFDIFYQERPLSEFDLFFFRAVGEATEWANLLLLYAQKKKIAVVDDYLAAFGPKRRLKSISGVFLAKNGISYPRTSFAANKEVLLAEAEKFKYPFVLKISKGGRRGAGTLLIKDKEVLARAIKGRIEKTGFLLQEYIPNDGDYRLMVIGYQVLGGFKRQKKEERLVLSRSLGPSEALKTIPQAVKEEAEKACQALKVEIASVDMVIDKRNGKPVIIEVNEAPQFDVFEKRTGIDVAEKIVDYLIKKAKK
ncbi:ATP-grasp domain-containing protein [Patescibacteria group bacterium]|nr:ATP-grasp domain-containing protein [Patescibacteria group bacterium]